MERRPDLTAPTRVERRGTNAAAPSEPGETARTQDSSDTWLRVVPSTLTPPPLATGALVSSYRIDRELGRGGMGVVQLARDERLHRWVAIKTVDRPRDEARAELLREARAAAALDHPGIVPVHAIEEHGARTFLVMPYVPGGTLHAQMRTGCLSPQAALTIALELTAALAHAHAHGVVHRDLKPGNVLIDERGHARIADFGLAERIARGPHDRSAPAGGTLGYIAPELDRPSPPSASPASDVYSMGVLLTELLAGEPPGSCARIGSFAELSQRIQRRFGARGRRVVPVLERALAHDPAKRFADARALSHALRAAVARDFRAAWVAMSLAVITLIAWSVLTTGEERGPAALEGERWITRQASDDPLVSIDIAPDGVTFVAATGSGHAFVVRAEGPRSSLEPLRTAVPLGRVLDVAWAGRDVLVVSRRSGEPSVVSRVTPEGVIEALGHGTHAAASVDGRTLAWLGSDALEVSIDGGRPRSLVTAWRGAGQLRAPIAISPNGRWIAFFRGDHASRILELCAVRVADGEERVLRSGLASWGADSRHSLDWSDAGILTTELMADELGARLVRVRVADQGSDLHVLGVDRSSRIEGAISRLVATPDASTVAYLRVTDRHGVSLSRIVREGGVTRLGSERMMGRSQAEHFSAFSRDGLVLSTRLGETLPFELVIRDPETGDEHALPPAARGRSLTWPVPDAVGGWVAWEQDGGAWRAVGLRADTPRPIPIGFAVGTTTQSAGLPPGWRTVRCSERGCVVDDVRRGGVALVPLGAAPRTGFTWLEGTPPAGWDLDVRGRVARARNEADGQVVVSLDGQDVVRVEAAECARAARVAWDGPDAVLLAIEDECAGSHRIERVTRAGSRELIWGPTNVRPAFFGVSPDGRWLALTPSQVEADAFTARVIW